MDLTIFVPTRGRPDNLVDFASEFDSTKTASTQVVFVFDVDDQYLAQYIAKNNQRWKYYVANPSRRGMVGALNQAYGFYSGTQSLGYAIGFMGDDHRPRTIGWDEAYLENLRHLSTGFVYGNDLYQGVSMPTQVAFTADIAETLGYMCPPAFDHLCVDVVWKDWGDAIGRITYLDEIIVEHMHPLAGKSRNDKNYKAVNNNLIARHDSEAYRTYTDQGGFAEDVAKLKRLLGV